MPIGLGIDPSLTGTGLVSLNEEKIEKAILLKSKKNGDTPALELQRIDNLVSEIRREAKDCFGDRDGIVAIEGLAFMARNTTALVQLSALNYFIRKEVSAITGKKFVIVAPSSLKKFVTGRGNAKKSEMFLEIYKRWGETFDDDNLADAFGLAKIAHAVASGSVKGLNKHQIEVIDLIKNQVKTI